VALFIVMGNMFLALLSPVTSITISSLSWSDFLVRTLLVPLSLLAWTRKYCVVNGIVPCKKHAPMACSMVKLLTITFVDFVDWRCD
jgi:hypothetical protein